MEEKAEFDRTVHMIARWQGTEYPVGTLTLDAADPDLYVSLVAFCKEILAKYDTQEKADVACAWSDYRRDYGASGAQEHKAFVAGWKAAREGDQSSVLR